MAYPTIAQLKELKKNPNHRLWLDSYDRIVQFEKVSDRFPKRHEKYHGHHLGAWSQRQRRNYKNGSMELWRFEMLKAIDFPVELPDPFEENVKKIGQLWKEHPESWPFIPRKFCYDDYDRLQMWSQDNRKRYHNGELEKNQIELLNSINFPLNTKTTKWEQDLSRFKNFVKKHNRYPKRTVGNYEENCLAGWRFHKLRLLKKGLLPKDKLKDLLTIQPDLLKSSLKKKNSWDLRYEILIKTWEEKDELRGKIPVPKNHKDYKMWYDWFNMNKYRFKNGLLPKEKVELLVDIGFNFFQNGYALKD